LEIYVHFGSEEAATGSIVASTLGALRDGIIAKFSDETRKFPAPDRLIVQTKDADNKLHPLKNDAKLKLDGVLERDKYGDYKLRMQNNFWAEFPVAAPIAKICIT